MSKNVDFLNLGIKWAELKVNGFNLKLLRQIRLTYSLSQFTYGISVQTARFSHKTFTLLRTLPLSDEPGMPFFILIS